MKNTDEAPPVAERHKTGFAGSFVEAESDCQSVPNYLSMENVENLIARVCRKMRRDGEVNANYITTNSPRVCRQHSCRGKTIRISYKALQKTVYENCHLCNGAYQQDCG